MRISTLLATVVASSALSLAAHAGQIPVVWNGWTQLDAGVDHHGNVEDRDFSRYGSSYVDPGYGGQKFDAEYLFYKWNGATLSIGLQTGFDILDGNVYYNNKRYYSGDLALSFDGSNSAYEYAIDFGYFTRDYYGNRVGPGGQQAEGLYAVNTWDNDILFNESAPYGVGSGSLIGGGASRTGAGEYGSSSSKSYWLTYDIDLSQLAILDSSINLAALGLDAHWTMSCGNDAIDGSAQLSAVPVPAALYLMASALGLLGFIRRKSPRK